MARRKIMGSDSGSSGGGGGSDDDKKSSSSGSGKTVASVQAQINAALDASGGAWTSELNDLVAERDSLSGGGDKGTAEYNMFGDKISEGGATDTQLATQSQYANEKVGGGTSGTETSVTPVQTVSVQTDDDDPVYYDAFGGSHSSFASASAADQQYIAQEQAAQAQIAAQQQAAAEQAAAEQAAAAEQQKEMSFFNNLFGSPAAAATPPGEQIPSGISGDDPYEMEYYPEKSGGIMDVLGGGVNYITDALKGAASGIFEGVSDKGLGLGQTMSGFKASNLGPDPFQTIFTTGPGMLLAQQEMTDIRQKAIDKGFDWDNLPTTQKEIVKQAILGEGTDSGIYQGPVEKAAEFFKEKIADPFKSSARGLFFSDEDEERLANKGFKSGGGSLVDQAGNLVGAPAGDVHGQNLADYGVDFLAKLNPFTLGANVVGSAFEPAPGIRNTIGNKLNQLQESGELDRSPAYQIALQAAGGDAEKAKALIAQNAATSASLSVAPLSSLDAVIPGGRNIATATTKKVGTEAVQGGFEQQQALSKVASLLNEGLPEDRKINIDTMEEVLAAALEEGIYGTPGIGSGGTSQDATTDTSPAADPDPEEVTVPGGELVPNIQVGDLPTLVDPSVIQNPDQANLLTQRPVPYDPGGGPIVVSPTAGELASSPIGIQSAYEQAALDAPNLEIEQTAPTLNEVKAAQDIIDEMLSTNDNVVDFKTLQGIQEQTNLSMEQLADMTGQTIAANEQMGTDPANLNQPPVSINTALSDPLLTPPNIETNIDAPDPNMTMPNLQDFDMSLLDPSGPTQADPEGILSLATQTGEQPKMEGVSPLTVVQPSDQDIDPFVYEGEILGGEPSTETVTPSKGPMDFEDAEFVDVGTDLEVVTPKSTVVTTTDSETDTSTDDDTTISIPITTETDTSVDTETDNDSKKTMSQVEREEDDPEVIEIEEPGGGESDDPQMNVVTVGDDEDDEEAPFTCPDGYEAVKQDGIWVCEKIAKKSKARKGRPTIGTRPYVTRPGFAKRTKTYESA